MEDLITRLKLRATIQDYVTQLMAQNQLTAAQVEDALNYTLLLIKDAVMNDYAIYAERDKTNAIENARNSQEEGTEPQNAESE